jgi:hypothetical protein
MLCSGRGLMYIAWLGFSFSHATSASSHELYLRTMLVVACRAGMECLRLCRHLASRPVALHCKAEPCRVMLGRGALCRCSVDAWTC